jgi:uncharacterized protein (TIGR03437 family)
MRYFCVWLLGMSTCLAANFTHGQAARGVVGQPYFTADLPGATQSLVGAVSGLAYANDTLFVADSNRAGASPVNNRVLIYHNMSSQFPDPVVTPPNQGSRCPVCGGTADVVLGQANFTATDPSLSQSGLALPTAVATDGQVLAVADTNNNRVLVWKSIPTSNNRPADVVIGQSDFTSLGTSVPPTAKSLRGPQGVWIQDGKLYIADTQDHRVLIYNSIPTSNGVAADLVLGQPNFTTFVQPDLTQAQQNATANNLLNPVSVTSDGVHLFVTDLGHNRVLIWNSIPTTNQQPANVALGQPDLVSAIANNTTAMCASNGKTSTGTLLYPNICDSVLSFPRYALSDGNFLFIADGGNDRVTVYYQVPTKSGAKPDVILGQAGGGEDVASDSTDAMSTPTSLAWDGNNLFVADTYNLRILIFTRAEPNIPIDGVRNAASLEIYAEGSLTFGGTINAGDQVTVKIDTKSYIYKVVKNDTFNNIVNTLVSAINAGSGDPNVIAVGNTTTESVDLIARLPGVDGNNVTYSDTLSTNAQLTVATGGATLTGGANAAQVGPGSLISIFGTNLSDSNGADPGTGDYAPLELANTQVFIDGSPAPLIYVSPHQINAQMPLFGADTGSVSVYVRTQHVDGSVTVTTAVPVTVLPENPGIFAQGGNDPRPGLVYHGSPFANGLISVDGTIKAGDVGTIKISSRTYNYTVLSTDTLTTVTQALAKLVNKDPQVIAYPADAFTRVVLQARKEGKAGEGITFAASVNTGASLLLTPIGVTNSAGSTELCCANTGRVTGQNPAIPGELITIYATGLGALATPNAGYTTGRRYDGPAAQPAVFLSSLAGGKTANVVLASPLPGSVGIWEVQLQLDAGLTSNKDTELTIAQYVYVSNVIKFPVRAP